MTIDRSKLDKALTDIGAALAVLSNAAGDVTNALNVAKSADSVTEVVEPAPVTPTPVPPTTTQLPAPNNFKGTAADLKITLTWGAVPGAVSYNVWERKTAGRPVATVTTTSRTSGQLSSSNPLYYYSVEAVDANGVVGVRTAELEISSVDGATTEPAPTEPAPVQPTPVPAPPVSTSKTPTPRPTVDSTYVRVNSAGELINALATASKIVVSKGVVSGRLSIARPVTLVFEEGAGVNGGSVTSGYALEIKGAPGTVISGGNIYGAQKGVIVDNSNDVKLLGVWVHHTGMEAIHYRNFSSNGEISNCLVEDTAQDPAKDPGMGEGIYIGSAISNWGSYSGGKPDACNYISILNNTVRRTKGECLDIKEATNYGWVEGNTFDGGGMDGDHFADSTIDAKGNSWTIRNNTLRNGFLDLIQTHSQDTPYGHNNIFESNRYENAPGYAVNVHSKSIGTVVRGSNSLVNVGLGLTN